jgi:predicted DNA-binding transcriptional regulator AlpA
MKRKLPNIGAPEPAKIATAENPMLDDRQVAVMLGLKNYGTLAVQRVRHEGPPYFKLGRRVRYLLSDVQQWLLARRKVSQGDAPRPERRRRKAA